MFHAARFENTRPDGFSVLEVVSSPQIPNTLRLFVPLKRTQLSGTIAGPLADLHLTQTFGYAREQCDKTLEAVYRFPLPGDAAVTGVTVRFGAVTISAELKEREHAEAIYAEARQQGKQAALATRESPDVFTLSVAGLQPDQDVVVETHYVQLARMEGAEWSLRIPLTTSPRYVRQDEANSRHAQGQPLLLLRDPGHRFALDLLLRDAGSIRSSTHSLAVAAAEQGKQVRLKEGEVLPDRDCVLHWQARQDDRNPALNVLLHDDTTTGHVYFLALLTPPVQRPANGGVPREVILLLDHSGSMEGRKWEAADWTVMQCLKHLTPRDTFALGLFHNTTAWFALQPLPAEAHAVNRAISFLQRRRDTGGTQLGVALEQALHLRRDTAERARQLLIVTDAEVSDMGHLEQLATDEAERPDRRRISVVCIDAAPNALLVHRLTEQGGGVAKFLTSNPGEEAMTTAIGALLEEWRVPLLTGLRLEIDRPDALAVGRTRLQSSPESSLCDLGDLAAGRAVWIAGRVPRGERRDLTFRVLAANGREVAACHLDLTGAMHSLPAIKALFGARQLLALENLITAHYEGGELDYQLRLIGYDPDSQLLTTPRKLYIENAHQANYSVLRGLLVQEALNYGLACSETAFVAVRTEAGKRIEARVAVPNTLPTGWSDAFATGSVVGASHVERARMAEGMPLYGARGDADCRLFCEVSEDPTRALGSGFESCLFLPEQEMTSSAMREAMAQYGAREGSEGDDDNTLYDSEEPAPRPPARSPSLLQRLANAFHGGKPTSARVKRPAPVVPLFTGVPKFVAGEAVLFATDGTESRRRLNTDRLLSRLHVRFLDSAFDADKLPPDLTLSLYIEEQIENQSEDQTQPCVKMRLTDVMRQGGIMPLGLSYHTGQAVRLVLSDPSGAWAQRAPALAVLLI